MNCITISSPAKPISLKTDMIQRLIGEGETEGWGSDLGISFVHNGKLYFLGGDTNGPKGMQAANIIGVSDDLNPSDGINIIWEKDKKGNPKEFFPMIEPSSTVPAGAISISNIIYIFMMDVINWDYPATARSVLIKSEDNGKSFHIVWEGVKDNKFVNIAPIISDHPFKQGKKALYLIGSGKYRESLIYLAVSEIDNIENKESYLYFAGIENGSPIWKRDEDSAIPIINGVKVGELSVQWNKYLDKWLLAYFDYSMGDKSNMYFRTASNLWGPWSNPIFVFSGSRQYGWYEEVITREGSRSWGIPYGSYLLPDLSSLNNSKVYFTISLWIPYSIFLIEVDINNLRKIEERK
ncbi:MAG: DUF4185 domain-containing protein [Caldisericia bacterium]